MRDIEKMYFQIFVAEEQGFLWWRDGNSLDEPIVYETCVHVFGIVSPGPCCNYALKITAIKKLAHLWKESCRNTQI